MKITKGNKALVIEYESLPLAYKLSHPFREWKKEMGKGKDYETKTGRNSIRTGN